MAFWSQRPSTKRGLHRGRLRDVVVVLSVVSAWFSPVGVTTFSLAFILLVAGCGLHVLVKGQLIRNVTLCTDGAYAVVRHPYYLANYLIDTSFCLASGNVYLLVTYPFLFFWAYGPTLREEETRLASLHGDRFTAHQATVPRLFPDRTLWRGLGTLTSGFSWRRVTPDEWKRIFRFGYLGVLLALVHQARAEGLSSLLFWQGAADWLTATLVALGAVCLLAALVIPRREGHAPSVAVEQSF